MNDKDAKLIGRFLVVSLSVYAVLGLLSVIGAIGVLCCS